MKLSGCGKQTVHGFLLYKSLPGKEFPFCKLGFAKFEVYESSPCWSPNYLIEVSILIVFTFYASDQVLSLKASLIKKPGFPVSSAFTSSISGGSFPRYTVSHQINSSHISNIFRSHLHNEKE